MTRHFAAAAVKISTDAGTIRVPITDEDCTRHMPEATPDTAPRLATVLADFEKHTFP